MSRARHKEFRSKFAISEKSTKIEESVVEIAINETGFGKFSIKVTTISYLIYLNMSLTIISTGFVLPAAACDLQMNIFDKSLLGTTFLLGFCFSSVITGFLANLKGRRWVLLFALFLQGNSDTLQAIFSNYWIIIGLKFLSGFGSAGQNVVFTYLSECLPFKKRNFIFTIMEYFSILGHAMASAIGLGIIPLKLELGNQYYLFRSWNLYVLICATPAFILGLWLIFMPETPKYLAEIGLREKLLQVLQDMYQQNCKTPGNVYVEKLLNSGNPSLAELVLQKNEKMTDSSEESLRKRIYYEFVRVISIFKQPLLKNTLLVSTIAFTVTSSYYSLSVWIPEIFQRFENFGAGSNSNFCSIVNDDSSIIQVMDHEKDSFGCKKPVEKNVFINNLILCASSFPIIFLIVLLVKRWGIKSILASCCIVAMVLILGIYFVNSFTQTLILLCFYLAILATCMTFQSAYSVSIFSTDLRSSGVLVTGLLCRIGSVFGNFIFSSLRNDCIYFVILVGLLLLVAAISTILVREKD